MAKTNLERLSVIETKVDNIIQNINDLKDGLNKVHNDFSKKFATKDELRGVKNLLVWFGTIITGIVVGVVLYGFRNGVVI